MCGLLATVTCDTQRHTTINHNHDTTTTTTQQQDDEIPRKWQKGYGKWVGWW
jgi:hypothetical protein